MGKQTIINILVFLFLFGFVGCKDKSTVKKQTDNRKGQIEEINSRVQFFKDNNSEIDDYSDLQVVLADTIFLGSNIGKITNYKPKRDDIEYLLSVIIENEYENGIIVKDTFSNGTLTPWFGIFVNKTGYKNVKGIILEEALNNDTTKIDSILRIERTFIHFSKRVYVMDSIYK